MKVRNSIVCWGLLAICAPLSTTVRAAADTNLVDGMPRPGWTRMGQEDALALAWKSVAYDVLDAQLYYFGGGDVVFGRLLGKFQLTQISGRGSVCIAPTSDLFIPSVQKLRDGLKLSQVVRGADLRVAAFASTVPGCVENYTKGLVVYIEGRLSAAQLVEINLTMDQKLAAVCKIPASATPQGLLRAANDVYNLYPRYDKSDYPEPLEVEISFAVRGEVYEAVGLVDPRSVRLKDCVKAIVD